MGISQKKFVEHFENLYNSGAIYVWGANGDIITKALMDSLYASFKSATYNKDYYNAKLAEGKGKIGADCSGAFCKISGYDTTAKGYYNNCVSKGHISAIPKNKVCMVFNKNLTHIGAYLGNGITIEMRDSKTNVYKENLKTSRWYYFGIPEFVDYSTSLEELKKEITSSNNIVIDYQKWLNKNLDGEVIATDGEYGPKTKKQSVRLIQHIFNTHYGTNIKEDGEYGPNTRDACPTFTKLKKNEAAFSMITYIIHTYLYAVCKYDMNGIISGTKMSTAYSDYTKKYVGDYQNSTHGLKVDGLAGSATLYQMFK